MRNKVLIPEPKLWYAYPDEYHFFEWLESIPAVKEVVRVKEGLEITYENMDRESLYHMIALLTRYGLQCKSLASLCLSVDKEWFNSKDAYWYDSIFNDK